MKADFLRIKCIKDILIRFHKTTCLKVNFHKSNMIPLDMDQTHAQVLTEYLGCQIGTLPFTYLGLPLGVLPKIQDFFPLIKRNENRLACFSSMLSYGGKLQLVNAVLSALPSFHMSIFLLPKGVIEQIDKFRHHCLWRGHDQTKKNHLLPGKWFDAPRMKEVLESLASAIRTRHFWWKIFTSSSTDVTSPGLTLFEKTITTQVCHPKSKPLLHSGGMT